MEYLFYKYFYPKILIEPGFYQVSRAALAGGFLRRALARPIKSDPSTSLTEVQHSITSR
jgi:hypothetical protein